MIPLEPIQKVSGLTSEIFQKQFLLPQKPVILSDLTDDWAAKEKWSLEYFKENYGDLLVPVFSSNASKAGKKYMEADQEIPFREYIQTIQKGKTDLRLFLFNIFKLVPELKDDYQVHTIMDGFYKEFPFTFFGGAGSKVAMHYDIDMSNVFLTQFDGRKRVVLFDPDQSEYLYRLPFTVASYIDVDNPDYEKFPALKEVKGYECIIERGDTLFIPSGYWHYITYLDAGFSMSQRANDSVIGKVHGAINIASHFMVDRGMNKLFGEKWREVKEEIATWRAERTLQKQY